MEGKSIQFYIDVLGLKKSKFRFHKHEDGELAHYAKEAWDIEYEFPFGWSEIEGVHNRTDYDLLRHQEFSRKTYHILIKPITSVSYHILLKLLLD